MANLIMDVDCQQQQDNRQDAATAAVVSDEQRKPPTTPRKKVRRTSSMGGVRRIVEKRFQSIAHLMNEKEDVKTAKQWSQRLNSHLEAKTTSSFVLSSWAWRRTPRLKVTRIMVPQLA